MDKSGKSSKLNMHHGAFSRSLLVDRVRRVPQEIHFKPIDTRKNRLATKKAEK